MNHAVESRVVEQLSDLNATAGSATEAYKQVVRDTAAALRKFHNDLEALVAGNGLIAVDVEYREDEEDQCSITLSSEFCYFTIEADDEGRFSADTDIQQLSSFAERVCGITIAHYGGTNRLIYRHPHNGKYEADGDAAAMLSWFLKAIAVEMDQRAIRFNADKDRT